MDIRIQRNKLFLDGIFLSFASFYFISFYKHLYNVSLFQVLF